ncbi:hypothetical protein AB0I61_07670 [Polymorphospora rubra]|uniref:hypothetical protein n=1 Tax=Polymorphospora rubra TaxID=338584 RepID=UPI00340F0A59
MQIIEVGMLGVRASVLRLTRRDTPLRFDVFPMVHIGEPAFYTAVADRLRRCDLILAEGVGGESASSDASGRRRRAARRSVAISALTASYRLPARFKRSGLVEQDIRYEKLGVPVRYPDMTDAQFAAGWRRVPLWQRALTLVAAPLVGLERLAFGSRRALARHLELTDADWHDEFSDPESVDDLLALLGDQRDKLLITAMDEIHQQRRDEAITVAVVYGAQHVTPVVHGMRTLHGYSVRSPEWLTVFDF